MDNAHEYVGLNGKKTTENRPHLHVESFRKSRNFLIKFCSNGHFNQTSGTTGGE